MDQRSSLFYHFITDEEKQFYDIDTRPEQICWMYRLHLDSLRTKLDLKWRKKLRLILLINWVIRMYNKNSQIFQSYEISNLNGIESAVNRALDGSTYPS